jgi:hypothetical protein
MRTLAVLMLVSLLAIVPAAAIAGQHQMGGGMGQHGQAGGMGGGMMDQMCPMMGMTGGASSDPKVQAVYLKMKAEMMQKMGEIMQKYASELAGAK